MSSSSAVYVPYDLRPVKQTERRIILDILRLGRDAGIDASKCRYVGMGGIRFYEFEMFHRYLGIREMISLERDKHIIRRCEFNKPFGFISVLRRQAGDFIDEHKL